MAMINKLRNKAGTLIVGAVGFAIVSFVLADLLGPNSSLFGGQDNSVGVIAGQTVMAPEYRGTIDIMSDKFALRNGRRPSDVENNSIREQAWEKLISDIAFAEQFRELGIVVTEEEEIDMVQGKNIHPDLVAAFSNPETGEFDKTSIVQFLSNLSNLPVQNQAMWYSMEEDIITGRRRVKYDNLLVKTSYATLEESKMLYNEQTAVAEVRYLYVPYYAVGDSAVSVTDRELQEYLDEHAAEYEVEESRSMKYVTFPILPSGADTTDFQQEMTEIKEEFSTISDDSIYAQANTEFGVGYRTFSVDALPQILQADFENLAPGAVYGPFVENNYYNLYKISEMAEDTVYAARASHILFKGADDSDESKAEARSQALSVLRQIKSGADFAEMAQQHGTDGTASRGGDLGWFKTGAMVAPFQEAVFAATKPGLLPNLIETDFGYHIIDVTNPKTNKAFKIATISRLLIPSDNSRDEAFRKADFFAGTSGDLSEFEANAQNDNILIQDAPNIDKNARRFGTLANARSVVSWLYRDADIGSVSGVYEVEDNYVVAVMTGETEKGTASLDQVRNEITVKVKNQKKAALIVDQLNSATGDLDAKAATYGDDASIYTSSDLKLNSNSLPNVGFAPEAVGKAFALESGQKSEPFASENGVLIIEMISITPAPQIADYSLYKQQLTQQYENRIGFNIANAIKEYADIEDRRYKFF
jgi:peptidyl-prolyl cis-trans isomerase D